MRVYVVVTVFAGCISDVQGFLDLAQAETYQHMKQRELGIEPEEESESQHEVQLHELEVNAYPTSVATRRMIW